MSAVTVRKLGPHDAALFGRLMRQFKANEVLEPLEFLLDPRTVLFVAVDDGGEPAGWLYAYELVRPEGRCAMLLYEVEVLAEVRGRGHGRALVEALVEEARARGHLEMWVLTDSDNEAARALYATVGGEESEQRMFTWEFD